MNRKFLPYGIFFFLAGDLQVRVAEFQTEFAPPTYQVGDLIDAQYWHPANLGDYGTHFRIKSIEHKIVPDSNDGNQVGQYQIGTHLESISKERYSTIAVG